MKKNLLLTFTGLLVVFLGSSFFRDEKKETPTEALQPVGDTALRIIHAYVSLADNDFQTMIPVRRKEGNGNDAANNIYWGATFGLKTFFSQSSDWQLLDSTKNISTDVLQRCVFKNRRFNCYLIADAYRGSSIKTCTLNFLANLSGHPTDTARFNENGKARALYMEDAKLVCYVGQNGYMDFEIPNPPPQNSAVRRDFFILAPASQLYFKDAILAAGGIPVLWTGDVFSPEAYTLKASIDGWLFNESGAEICVRAAKAYDFYKKCGYQNALKIFVTGY